MRIICPNCDAQYEVPDAVIPPEGRDVQCSNCSRTWFQHHPDFAPPEPEPEAAAPEPAQPAPPPDPAPAPDPAPEAPAEADNEAVTAAPIPRRPTRPAADAPSETPRPPARELDPEVEGILREEAARETAARAAESGGLETQPELGADLPPEQSASAVPETNLDAAPRSELLPDIEEINSSLSRGQSVREPLPEDIGGGSAATSAPAPRSGSGFSFGLVLALVLFSCALLVYVFAPQIQSAVPQLGPTLTAYVLWVDAARVWLDGHAQNALQWLDQMASESGGGS